MRRLVELVLATPPEKAGRFTLEDMAVTLVYLGSGAGAADSAALRKRIDAWLSEGPQALPPTCGRRRQPLLRWAIGYLNAPEQPLPPRDAVDLMRAAAMLAARAAFETGTARVQGMLAPHEARLAEWAEALPLLPVESLFAGRIHYLSEDDLQRARTREVRLLAGIDLPHRGPVHTSPTPVRLLGDVPDGCTLVVEDGACYIDGYVLGRVLCKGHLEVVGNIAGVAISPTGDVRCRNMINNALVIAKLGSVHALRAEGARLVFAGTLLHVREDTVLGLLKARLMAIGGTVRGGDIHVAGTCTAHRFEHHRERHLSITLRRELTCEDYGEVTGAQLTQLLSAAHRSRTQARHNATLAALAMEEAEQAARSVLMYLYGGGTAHKLLEDMASVQRRLGTLRRVHRNIREVRQAAEDRLAGSGITAWFLGPETEWPQMESITELESDEPVDPDLAAANEEARLLHREILSRSLSRAQAARILRDTTAKLREMETEYAALTAGLKSQEETVASLQSVEALASSAERGDRYLKVLQRLLPKLREGDEPGMAERLRGGFVTVAMRNIDRRLRRAREYQALADKALANFNGASERLGREFQIRMLEPGAEDRDPASVRGRFAAEVWIYLDLGASEDTGNDLQRLVVTEESGDTIASYRRTPETAL